MQITPITGQVTYHGKPVSCGTIRFIPQQLSEGVRVAYGTLNEQGGYCLSTYKQGDGAILGDYRVAVVSHEELPVEVARRADMLGMAASGAKSLIPNRYSDPNTSGLTAHVATADNTINFELKD